MIYYRFVKINIKSAILLFMGDTGVFTLSGLAFQLQMVSIIKTLFLLENNLYLGFNVKICHTKDHLSYTDLEIFLPNRDKK